MFTKTRHPFLLVGKIGGDWSYFDPTDRPEGSPSRVGPIYKSKTEALADGPRYWRDNWGWHEDETKVHERCDSCAIAIING